MAILKNASYLVKTKKNKWTNSKLDAFMHNWVNPQKIENELSVPSDRHCA